MAINQKALLAYIKHPLTLAKVMIRCRDKADVCRYEKLIDDDSFLTTQKEIDAFKIVLVTDTTLWGGDLWMVFLPNEHDADYMYGLGVTTAYNSVIDFSCCGIRESNPIIAWVRHFFSARTSPNQKIDSFCLYALHKSLLPLCNKTDINKLYEIAEEVKSIPCEAWGDFLHGFYPYYKKIVKEHNLINTMEEMIEKVD